MDIQVVGVPQPKTMHGFTPNFQYLFVLAVAVATLQYLLVLNFVGFPQPKPMHRCTLNFQDVFIPTGS